MAKRITVEAKIILERADYVVEYVYKNGSVIGLDIWTKRGNYIKQLPVNASCWIENSLVEELLDIQK